VGARPLISFLLIGTFPPLVLPDTTTPGPFLGVLLSPNDFGFFFNERPFSQSFPCPFRPNSGWSFYTFLPSRGTPSPSPRL